MWEAAKRAIKAFQLKINREKFKKKWIESQKFIEPREISPHEWKRQNQNVFDQDLKIGDGRFSPMSFKSYRENGDNVLPKEDGRRDE